MNQTNITNYRKRAYLPMDLPLGSSECAIKVEVGVGDFLRRISLNNNGLFSIGLTVFAWMN